MRSYREIETEVNLAFKALRERERLKPKHQIIIESLNETLVNAEVCLTRWRTLATVVGNNSSFAQLCGDFIFEYGVLLKDKATLELNHFLEKNNDSINIYYFLNTVTNTGKRFINSSLWPSVKKQIKAHCKEIEKIKEDNSVLIQVRDKQIAHKDRKNLKSRCDYEDSGVSPELMTKVIQQLTIILDYYFKVLELDKQKTLASTLDARIEFGFDTGVEDLVSVVNTALETLNFKNSKVQRIANQYKLLGNI